MRFSFFILICCRVRKLKLNYKPHTTGACGRCYPEHRLLLKWSIAQTRWQHYYRNSIKQRTMSNLLYLIAVILVIGWVLGFFVWSAPGLIHILLVLAVIALLLGIIRRA